LDGGKRMPRRQRGIAATIFHAVLQLVVQACGGLRSEQTAHAAPNVADRARLERFNLESPCVEAFP
jgi:phosphoribosylformimino-5-aminoimidazole carboxamide ribonucleotide (ProFAR) isomerase